MTREQAVQRLLEELPEFSPFYEESDGRPTEAGDELLIHVVMGDLARFYLERGAHDPELATRVSSAALSLHVRSQRQCRGQRRLPPRPLLRRLLSSDAIGTIRSLPGGEVCGVPELLALRS